MDRPRREAIVRHPPSFLKPSGLKAQLWCSTITDSFYATCDSRQSNEHMKVWAKDTSSTLNKSYCGGREVRIFFLRISINQTEQLSDDCDYFFSLL